MAQAHLNALRKKHENLEQRIHDESNHAARNDLEIRRMKQEKLHIMEQIAMFSERRA